MLVGPAFVFSLTELIIWVLYQTCFLGMCMCWRNCLYPCLSDTVFYHERSQPIDKKTQVDTYLEFTVWLFLRIMIKIYACRFCVIFITKIQTKPQILLKTSWLKHVNSSPWSLWFKCIQDTWTELLSSYYFVFILRDLQCVDLNSTKECVFCMNLFW